MTLCYHEEGEYSLPISCEKIAEAAAEAALDVTGCPYEAQADLLVTTDDEIRGMNREFRGIDRPTDVLSFPAADYPVPGDFTFLEERMDLFHPETGELILGDIVVSKDRVVAQAQEYGHTVKREFAFLIVHSVLHLIGYDHMTETDRKMMEEWQRRILAELKIFR